MRRENLVRDSGCPVAETRLPTGRLTVRAPPLSGGETTTLAQVEPVVVLILAAVFIGALAQRITGMGFGLVSGPFLVLLLDPVSGVLLVNLCGIVAAATVFARTWREVEWPVFWKLAVGTVVGGEADDHPGLGRAGDDADDDIIELEAQFFFLGADFFGEADIA